MFKKSIVVGVAITPDVGIEVAQIDYATKTVLKYGKRSLDYNIARREISDFDLFKDTLQDLLSELNIPKGTELAFSIPQATFRVVDYPASLDDVKIANTIEEEVYENPYLQNAEPCISFAIVNTSLQFNKIAYFATQKTMVFELLLSIKDMGYKTTIVDASMNSLFHGLIYTGNVAIQPNENWVMVTIENNCCYIMSMSGTKYIDVFEEKIAIGEVLSDAENYATVIAAIEPILKNLPSNFLYVVSRTNVINAEIITTKLNYATPKLHLDANCYRKDDVISYDYSVNAEEAKNITFDVIGAAIYRDYAAENIINFNFFNKTLGALYDNEQPPVLFGGSLVLTNEKLIISFIVFAVIVGVLFVLFFTWYTSNKIKMKRNIEDMQAKIERINQYIQANSNVSGDNFDEGYQVKIGLAHNKEVYSYYTIVGTEIPQKLWLTHLKLDNAITIEGRADNIESIYSFYRNIKDYNPGSTLKLQKLGLGRVNNNNVADGSQDSLLTTMNADFYEFCISNNSSCGNTTQAVDENQNQQSEKNTNFGSRQNSSSRSNDDKKSQTSEVPGELEIIN